MGLHALLLHLLGLVSGLLRLSLMRMSLVSESFVLGLHVLELLLELLPLLGLLQTDEVGLQLLLLEEGAGALHGALGAGGRLVAVAVTLEGAQGAVAVVPAVVRGVEAVAIGVVVGPGVAVGVDAVVPAVGGVGVDGADEFGLASKRGVPVGLS